MNIVIYLLVFILKYNYGCYCQSWGENPGNWIKEIRKSVVYNDFGSYIINQADEENYYDKSIFIRRSDSLKQVFYKDIRNLNEIEESILVIDSENANSMNNFDILQCYPSNYINDTGLENLYEPEEHTRKIFTKLRNLQCSKKPYQSFVINFNDTNEHLQNFDLKYEYICCVKIINVISRPNPYTAFKYTYYDKEEFGDKSYREINEISDEKLNAVLVCVEDNDGNDIIKAFDAIPMKLQLTQDCERETEKHKGELLAVIIPKPFETDISIPLVTYATPPQLFHSTSNDNIVPFHLNDPFKIYGIALIRIIEKLGWQRIAILSDNYENSIEIESNLVSLFDNNGLVYTVVRGVENSKGLNFMTALNTLKKADTRIIIVNVDERNIQLLTNQIDSAKYSYLHAWILINAISRNFAKEFVGDVIRIDLSPASDINILPSIFNSLSMSSMSTSTAQPVLESVIQLQQAYRTIIREEDSISYRKVHRQLIKALRSRTFTKTQVYIRYRNVNHVHSVIGAMIIEDFKIVKEDYNLVEYIIPDLHECLIRGTNFFKPCTDLEFILLMFVIIASVISCMSIVIFFTDINTMPSRRRYRTL